MKRSLSIKLKAIFLLVVFSLSTPVTFACAAGMDMGYNKDHHTKPGQEISHHQTDTPQQSMPDDCCRDEGAKFEKSDKLNRHAVEYKQQPSFTYVLIKLVFSADPFAVYLHNTNSGYLTRNHHPPIKDKRLAIQSFLI